MINETENKGTFTVIDSYTEEIIGIFANEEECRKRYPSIEFVGGSGNVRYAY